MSIPMVGFGTACGLAQEVTYRTPVARVYWARVSGFDLDSSVDTGVVEDLGDGATSNNSRATRTYQAAETVGGTITGPILLNDRFFTTLLKHALGTSADAGANPYTHTATMLSALPVGLTIEKLVGGLNGYSEVFAGCKVNKLTIDVPIGKPATFTADIIGGSSAGPTAVGSPSPVSIPSFLRWSDAGSFTWNGVVYPIQGMRLTIDNKLGRRFALGSVYTLEPTRTANTEVTCELDIERLGNDWHTAHRARTQATGTVTFTGDSPAALAVSLWHAQPIRLKPAIAYTSVVDKVVMQCFGGANGEGLTTVVTNAIALTY